MDVGQWTLVLFGHPMILSRYFCRCAQFVDVLTAQFYVTNKTGTLTVFLCQSGELVLDVDSKYFLK